MNIILYHANCADGFAAAFAAWLNFGDDATYIPVRYGNDFRNLFDGIHEVSPGCSFFIYILDFSWPREELFIMERRGDVETVVVLDHHKTAAEELRGLPDPCTHQRLTARFDMEKSGAVLAWEYFHPGRPVPEMLRYVQDRDIHWPPQMVGSREINAALWRGQARDFATWKAVMEIFGEMWADLQAAGDAILTADAYTLDTIVSSAERDFETLSYRVNSPVLQSELGEKLLADDPLCDYVDVWWERHGVRHHSLRSRKGGVDVSAIAKLHGGGGHHCAAGYRHGAALLPAAGTTSSTNQADPSTEEVFEVLDVSNDEIYYPIGIFMTLEEAIECADRPPNEWGSDGEHDECATVKIRRRKCGWERSKHKTVWTQSWVKDWEGENEGEWKRLAHGAAPVAFGCLPESAPAAGTTQATIEPLRGE